MENCPAHFVVRRGSKVVGTLEGTSVKISVNSWLFGVFSWCCVVQTHGHPSGFILFICVQKWSICVGYITYSPHTPGVGVESLCETPRVEENRKGVKMLERKEHWRDNISIWNMLMSSDMGEMWSRV